MKRLFTACMLAVITLCTAFQASAYEWVDIELGEAIPVAGFGKFYGKYTATETKTLYEQSRANTRVYTEEFVDEVASASALVPAASRTWTGDYTYTYKLDVVAGTTYYFVMDAFEFDAWNFKLYAPVEFGIEHMEPAENAVISQLGVGDGRIYITFTEPPLSVSYARLGKTQGFSTTNTGSTICPTTVSGRTLGIDIQNVMLALYNNGLQAGDGVTLAIRLKKQDNTFWTGNSNGIHKITFVAARKPVTKVSEKVPLKILSYMAPDNEDGKLVLTFDGDLDPNTSADQIIMEYGDKESEDEADYAEYPIPFTIEGSVLTLDFTGKSRRRAELLPYSTKQYETIDVRVKSLKDSHGSYVNSEGQGTVGSYSWRIPYEELPVVNISQEIIPANGTSLDGVEVINWWFDNANQLSFDGVRFDYVNEDGDAEFIVIPMSEIRNEGLSAAEMDLWITVPEALQGAKNIILSLNNLKSIDGIDHSAELSARYDAFTITSIIPAAGSTLEKLSRGDVIKVTSNFDADQPDMYLTYDLIDNNPDSPDQAILLSSYMVREDDGSHTCEIFYDMPLYLGHTYSFRVNYFEDELASHGQGGYQNDPQGYDEVKWIGATEPFSFSTYQFESVSPADGTEITDPAQNVFTLVFDGMVMLPAEDCKILLGAGKYQPFESVEPVEPVDGYANTWVATVSPDFMSELADFLKISFKAYDMNGKVVEGNAGTEAGSYFYFSYPVSFNIPEFTCEPADGSTVEKLSSFTLSYEEGICQSYNTTEKIQLVSKTAVIHTFDEESFEYVEDEDETGATYVKAIILTLPEEVTTDGTYTLMVPDKYFNLGSEQATRYSKAQSFAYIVHAPQKAPAYTLDPAEGKVEQLGMIKITFTDCTTVSRDATIPFTFTCDGEPVRNDNGVLCNLSVRGVSKALQIAATVSIDGKTTTQYLTKDGVYELTIPAGALTIDGVKYMNDIVLTWQIGEDKPVVYPITFNPPHADNQPHLEYVHMVWDDEEEIGLGSGKATLEKPDGTVVELPDAELDLYELNKANQHLGQKHEAQGKYILTFPAGYFQIISNGDAALRSVPTVRDEQEIKVTYTVAAPTSVGEILNPEDGVYNVYDINGVAIKLDGSIEDVKALPAGMYIINGEKFILR